ncbi:hypothetical protein [Pantoea septica]|uniref:hypothetical protein n=1 Tax=Pantoea septica TaxID=472695 RepID=UPI0028B155BA|nr:hypothetical protein [Pantoea septica]
MNFVNDPLFLKKVKHNLVDPEKTVHMHGKCPHCASTIEYYEVHTSPCPLPGRKTVVPAFDESGMMIGKCKYCDEKFKVDILNPDFSGFDMGWMKLDFYMYSDSNREKEIEYNEIEKIVDFLKKETKLTDRKDNYDFSNYPLYVCHNCNENLEIKSLEKLKKEWGSIACSYGNYTNWALSQSRGPAPENIIIKFSLDCSCGKSHLVFLQSKYLEITSFENHSFNIINIIGAKNISDVIFGVYTKTNIMSWLYKLLARWNFIYDRVYLISPFVGHQFLRSEDLVNAWLKLLNYLQPNKTSILVRSGQSKLFKTAFSKTNEISYEEMERFNLGSELINELTAKTNFHAKIFCAVSPNKCEIMNGSSNLVEGPSFEVVNFDTIDNYSKAYDLFLKPLGINDLSGQFENLYASTYSLLFDEANDFNVSNSVLQPKDHINFFIHNLKLK